MKKSFKTLATFLSIMSLIPNLSSIRAEGESTSSLTSSSKQTESEESKEPARKRQKLTEETEKPIPETQKSTEKPVQEIIDYIEEILSDAYADRHLAFGFRIVQDDFSKQDYNVKMRIIKERSKIVQQNMKKFEERIFPTGNNIFSSDDFKVLYLMFMMKNLSQGPYRDFISTYSVIDILCICDKYEKISEIFESGCILAILDKTRLNIRFFYKDRYKISHKISLEHQLGSLSLEDITI